MRTQLDSVTVTPGRYLIVPGRSVVLVRTRHLFGLGPVRGTFALASGAIAVADPLAATAITAEIAAASFDSGNRQRDRAVRSARFLAADQFPVISFRCDAVSGGDQTVTGSLTVRDVTRPVALTVTGCEADGRELAATATTRIDRTDFGITASPGLAARFLDLTVEVRCTGN